jgi:hypothetical protein
MTGKPKDEISAGARPKRFARSRAMVAARAPLPGVSAGRSSAANAKRQRPTDRSAPEMLLTTILQFLQAAGVSRDLLARELRIHAQRLQNGQDVRAVRRSSYWKLVNSGANVLYEWCRDPECVGADGEPRPLPLRGRALSVSHLIARCFPRGEVSRVLAWMQDNGILKRQENGLFVIPSRSFVIGSLDLIVDRAASLVSGLLDAMLHNARSPNKNERNFDRVAHVMRLSPKHLPRLRAFVETQGQSFIEIIDDWLEGHNTAQSDEPTMEVGVEVYLYTRAAQPAARRKRT